MNAKRRLAVVIGVGVAPLLAVTLPAATASAHGYVSSPPSRQAQCAAGVVDCGQIKYEPQSVEGPKGLQSCSGGHAEYAELNDDSKPWRATAVGSSTDFSWKLTARHATSSWQYFIGGSKLAQFNDGGAQPGATVTHRVDFGGITGRQKVLAVWNIADRPTRSTPVSTCRSAAVATAAVATVATRATAPRRRGTPQGSTTVVTPSPGTTTPGAPSGGRRATSPALPASGESGRTSAPADGVIPTRTAHGCLTAGASPPQ